MKFVETPSNPSGSALRTWEWQDPITGRHFEMRELAGPVSIEIVAGKRAPDGLRYFAAEYIPNGRVVRWEGGSIVEALDIPDETWRQVKATPSKTLRAIGHFLADRSGFQVVRWGGGLGISMICYSSIAQAEKAVENAIEADVWLASSEPVKHFVLADRCLATMKAKSMLDAAPGQGQIMAAISELAEHLSRHETLNLSDHCGRFRITISDSRKEQPDGLRCVISLGTDGRPVLSSAFVRGQWGDVADRIAGARLPRYDGPAGIAIDTLPGYGQSFASSASKPSRGWTLEVLHNQEGTSNKIYVRVRMGNDEYLAWGKFAGGCLRCKRAQGDGYTAMHAREQSGYNRISPCLVPDIDERLARAVARLADESHR